MQCHNAIERLSEFLEHDLPPREEAAMAAHLAACEQCRAEAAALEQAEVALRSLAAVVPAPDLTADLRRRIATPVRSFRWAWCGAAAVALAAIALLALRPPHVAVAPKPQGTSAAKGVVSGAAGTLGPTAQTQDEARESGLRQPVGKTGESPRGPSQPPRRAPHAIYAIVKRSAGRERVRPAWRTGQPLRVIAPAPMGTQAAPAHDLPAGVVLVVGEPQPVLPSSSYFAEVTLPDGQTSTFEQTIQRDPAGEPRAIRISYQQTPPPASGAEWRLQ